jgi:hypothetical protein
MVDDISFLDKTKLRSLDGIDWNLIFSNFIWRKSTLMPSILLRRSFPFSRARGPVKPIWKYVLCYIATFNQENETHLIIKTFTREGHFDNIRIFVKIKKQNIPNWGESDLKIVSFFVLKLSVNWSGFKEKSLFGGCKYRYR